jgi:hypothetical protein
MIATYQVSETYKKQLYRWIEDLRKDLSSSTRKASYNKIAAHLNNLLFEAGVEEGFSGQQLHGWHKGKLTKGLEPESLIKIGVCLGSSLPFAENHARRWLEGQQPYSKLPESGNIDLIAAIEQAPPELLPELKKALLKREISERQISMLSTFLREKLADAGVDPAISTSLQPFADQCGMDLDRLRSIVSGTVGDADLPPHEWARIAFGLSKLFPELPQWDQESLKEFIVSNCNCGYHENEAAHASQ